jgi:hypothetical protein
LLALLDKIRGDTRHNNLQVIAQGPLRRRVFNDWGMVLRDPESEHEILSQLSCRQNRKWRLSDLAEDPLFCYSYITAHADKLRR